MLLKYSMVGAVLVSIGLALGWANERSRHASTKAEWAAERAAIAEARTAAERQAAERLEQQVAQADKLRSDYEAELARQNDRIRALLAMSDRLRSAAAARDATSAASSNPIAACRADATLYRELFLEADATAGELAQAADRHSSEVAVLLEYAGTVCRPSDHRERH